MTVRSDSVGWAAAFNLQASVLALSLFQPVLHAFIAFIAAGITFGIGRLIGVAIA